MDQKYYLGIFEKDWSDEFDYKDVFVCTQVEYDNFKKITTENSNKEINVWFGTNEGWEDIEVEEIVDSFSWQEISKSTFDELKAINTWSMMDDVLHAIQEEEDY